MGRKGGYAVNLHTQYLTLIAMSISGAILGAVYDVYRIVLKQWRFLRILGPVFDLLFWLFALGLVFWALLWANNGDVRLYVFIILLLGLFLYRILFHKMVVKGTVGVILGIKALCLFVYRMVLMLIVKPLIMLIHIFIMLLRVVDRIAQFLENIILWPFAPLLRILYKFFRWIFRPVEKPCLQFWGRIKKVGGILTSLSNWLFNKNGKKPKDPKG